MPELNQLQHVINTSTKDGQMVNGTAGIELYTVAATVAIILPFSVLAVLTNVALLMSTRCKRSICRLQYGLPYCLAASNVLFCAFWAPLDLTRIIMEYANIGMNAVPCHLDVALQYFCITIIILIHVFLVVQHVHVISKPKDEGRDTTVVIGLISCPVVAVGVAVVVTFQYKESSNRLACLATNAVLRPYDNYSPVPVGMVIVNCIWLLLLFIALVELILTIIKQKLRLIEVQKSSKSYINSKHSLRKGSNADPSRAELSVDNEKSISDCHSSRSREANSPKSTLRNTFQHMSLPKHIGRKNSKDQANSTNDDSDMDDDEFDQKMKLQLQKSLSGRRHTVANIGLGDSSFATTSKERLNKKGNADPSFNYQYVRKWSVDIQALQDQLQNPKKADAIGNPFRSLSRLQEGEENKPKEAEKKKTEEKVMFKDEDEIITSPMKEKSTDKIIEEEEEEECETDNNDSLEKSNDIERIEEEPKPEPSASSALIQATDDDEDKNCVNDQDEEASQGLLSVDSLTAPFNSVSVIQNAKQGKESMEREDEKKQTILQDEQRQLISEQLQTAGVCLFLVLIVVICTVPFIMLQLLACTSLLSSSMARNLSTIFGTVCLVQCFLQPLLIAWMQNKIWQALLKLRSKMSQLKCVCYCNIGKRQQCVGRNST